MGAFVFCIVVILTVTFPHTVLTEEDAAPHEWNISRDMWLARAVNRTYKIKPFEPVRLVIVHHTVTGECHRFVNCAAMMRNLQSYFLNKLGYDIPYNFMIGNDGRVYEGRGLGVIGAHTHGYNMCSLGLGFIGDYREEIPTHTKVTPLQVKNVQRLLDEAVKKGFLHPDYYVVGAKDLRNTVSPGSNLYKEIQSWPHFDHAELFRDKNCGQIHDMFQYLDTES